MSHFHRSVRSLVRKVILFSPLLACLLAPAPGRADAPLGASYNEAQTHVTFNVYSSRATRIEVWIYAAPFGEPEKAVLVMAPAGSANVWSATVAVADLAARGVRGTIYYGYRAWGPNWPHDPAWHKGSLKGFREDADAAGNRFNPNKLLLDPYAREVSHDPRNPRQPDGTIYNSGERHRATDTGQQAPKGIVLRPSQTAPGGTGTKPTRPFKDEIIYEVHLRGLTKKDPSVPETERGTYAGAARKAAYLRSLGVTAVEFLPLQESQNDQNDINPHSVEGDNYWGYDPYNFFAPDRRYAVDKSPGGPTREFKALARAFHDQGLKIYIDMVYNHTGEGPVRCDGTEGLLLSWRGLDNPTYYVLRSADRRSYVHTNIIPVPNVNTAHPVVRQQVLDALRYWKDVLGVDGYRFDLGPVLGNKFQEDRFQFDPSDPRNILNRAVRELPARPAQGGDGVELIAEPWGGEYVPGRFPVGWAEWNDAFRYAIRKSQNRLGSEKVTPADLAEQFAGSPQRFRPSGRKPWAAVNYIVCHDGFNLRDLYTYNEKQNQKLTWPYGPSEGGDENNFSWDQGGDPARQRQAARTGLALVLLSAGVPMITGGDEMYRTQFGNNNPFNVDSPAMYLDYADAQRFPHFFAFSKKLLAFRRAHPALRPAEFFRGRDGNRNGLKDITWLRDNGQEADRTYLDNPDNHFLAYRIDGTELWDPAASLYVAYNGWKDALPVKLPANLRGKHWYRVSDTAGWMEEQDNFRGPDAEERLGDAPYVLQGRSVLILIEK